MTERRENYRYISATAGSPLIVAGSAALDPLLADYLRLRWRACMTELRYIAALLGWESRLPPRDG